MVTTLTPIIVAYLLGAIPFGLFIAKLFGVKDIRQSGSGNIGATNVYRVAGLRAAVWVYILDVGKGVAAVLIAGQADQSLLQKDLFLVLTALAAVLGHCFPVYIRFRGGKGVNTALGCLTVLLPVEILVCIAVFAVVALLSRYISLASVSAALCLPIVLFVERFALKQYVPDTFLFFGVLIAALVLLTHRGNIRRLLEGRESRFSFSHKSGGAGSHV